MLNPASVCLSGTDALPKAQPQPRQVPAPVLAGRAAASACGLGLPGAPEDGGALPQHPAFDPGGGPRENPTSSKPRGRRGQTTGPQTAGTRCLHPPVMGAESEVLGSWSRHAPPHRPAPLRTVQPGSRPRGGAGSANPPPPRLARGHCSDEQDRVGPGGQGGKGDLTVETIGSGGPRKQRCPWRPTPTPPTPSASRGPSSPRRFWESE